MGIGTMGYNRIEPCRNPRFQPDHTIHLRLRHPDNVDVFRTYDEVVHTIAHELAHCIHRNHGESFFGLMKEILKEYKYRLDHKREENRGEGHAGDFDITRIINEVDFSGYDSDDWYLFD